MTRPVVRNDVGGAMIVIKSMIDDFCTIRETATSHTTLVPLKYRMNALDA